MRPFYSLFLNTQAALNYHRESLALWYLSGMELSQKRHFSTFNRMVEFGMSKVCPDCKKKKESKEFYFHGATHDHLSHFCRVCHRARVKARREELKDKT